jgi:hypothetical protein
MNWRPSQRPPLQLPRRALRFERLERFEPLETLELLELLEPTLGLNRLDLSEGQAHPQAA